MVFLLLLMGGMAGGYFASIEAAYFIRDEYLKPQPVIEEVHTIVRVGSSFSHNGGGSYGQDPNWSYIRTRSLDDQIFVVGVSNRHIFECEVGQTIVVERQGLNIGLTDEGCKKRTATVEQ